jgi:hypothetical protein
MLNYLRSVLFCAGVSYLTKFQVFGECLSIDIALILVDAAHFGMRAV